MIAAAASPSQASSSGSRRRSGTRPSAAPLLDWETARSILLIETERTVLLARITRLKLRSHARIVLEDRLRVLTTEALRLQSQPSNET